MGDAWQFAGWFYKRDGEAVGPLSSDQVQHLLESGLLRPMDRLWNKWIRPAECQFTAATAQAACKGEPRLSW